MMKTKKKKSFLIENHFIQMLIFTESIHMQINTHDSCSFEGIFAISICRIENVTDKRYFTRIVTRYKFGCIVN